MAWRADSHIDTLPYMHTGLAPPSNIPGLAGVSNCFPMPKMPFLLLPISLMARFMHVMYAYAYSTVHLTNFLIDGSP
ncbi:hypothetical protein B0T13DRAFT_504988, partial [Neurospora crassa]